MSGLPDITSFRLRKEQLDAQLADPSFYQNARKAADVTREHQQLTRLLEKHQRWEKLAAEKETSLAISRDMNADADMRELATQELAAIDAERLRLETEILSAMLPSDPADSRNTVLEIRAGTGGAEASLFAAELHRMYTRFSEGRGWKVQPLSSSPSDLGGFREIISLITGQDVYRVLKFESGVQRVQRVPVTEANGRIHTSTVTVAVLPEAEEVDVQIDPSELEITVTRASGPGGQGVNTTDSAVQILHKPTGIIVSCADERSQLKNKAKALTVLRSRLLKAKEDEERAKYAENRRSQIGTGDRSERIRTYNFPQNRVTDHRIGLTLYSLPHVMEGRIDEIVELLEKSVMEEKLAALTGMPTTGTGFRRMGGADDE